MRILAKMNDFLEALAQTFSVTVRSPTEARVRFVLFIVGASFLFFGLSVDSLAQVSSTDGIHYNDDRITNPVNAVMTYLEGSFGALVMMLAGCNFVVAAMVGWYKRALFFLGLAVGAFLTRSVMATVFNDISAFS